MRRLLVLGVTSIALVMSFAAFSGTALANTDPDCDGTPYNNDFEVRNFQMVSTTTNVEHRVADMNGSGSVCGADINPWTGSGAWSLSQIADIVWPPGVAVNPTDVAGGPQVDSYTGTSSLRVMVAMLTAPTFEVTANVRVRPISECQTEEDSLSDFADHTGTIIACYQARTQPGSLTAGHAWLWVVQNGTQNTTVIGPFHADLGLTGGITSIHNFTLCGYAGATGSAGQPGTCGDSSQPWLQKNGDATTNNCADGNGLYHASVINYGDGSHPQRRTPDTLGSQACAPWTPDVVTDPDCDGTPYNNDFRVRDFSVETVDGDGDTPNHTPGATASLRTKALICSTALQSGGNNDTMTDHVDLLEARGFATSNTFSMENNSYAGKLTGRIAYRDANGTPHIGTTTDGKLRVDPLDIRWLEGSVELPIQDNCNREADNPSSGGVAGRGIVGLNAGVRATWDGGMASIVFACFKASGTIADGSPNGKKWHAWVWKTQGGFPAGGCNPLCVDGYGRQYLTIGPIHVNDNVNTGPNDADIGPAGMTDISQFRICGYLGTVGGDNCGDSTRPVLHTNGSTFGAGCGDLNNAYQLRVVRKNGSATDLLNRPSPIWTYADCVGEPARSGDPPKPPRCSVRDTARFCKVVPKPKDGSPTRRT